MHDHQQFRAACASAPIRSAWIAAAVILLVTGFHSPTYAGKVVRVGAYQNSPKIYIDDHGHVAGFWPDLLTWIAQQEDWEIQYVPGSWQENVEQLIAGEIDLMPDVAYTEARAQRLVFSDYTVLMSWSRLYIRGDSPEFHSIRDLEGRTVAALKRSVNLEGPGGFRAMVNSFNISVTFLELPDYDAVFAAVQDGSAAAGITNRNFGNRNAARYGLRKTPLIFQPANLKFAFPPDAPRTPDLKARIDHQLALLQQDNNSVYYQLLAHYFEAEMAEKPVEVWPSWLARLLQGTGLLLVMVFTVLVISRREVARKTRELEQRNEELAEGERRYREIFNAPADAIFIHELRTGRVLDVNRAVLEMYEISYEDALVYGPRELSSDVEPYTQERAVEHLRKAITEGPQVFEWHARKTSGELFWVEVALQRTSITGQDRIIAVVRDINERKQAVAELAAERERLSVTLRSIGDAVITTDIDSTVVLLNKVAEELTGWPAAEAIGKPLPEILRIKDQDTGGDLANPVESVLASGRISGLPHNTVLIGRDGRRRLIADSVAPIRDAQSELVGAVLVFRDVTDQTRMEQEVLKVKKLESVGVLAGGIAHDFNNILSAIMGNLELAAQEVGSGHGALPLLTAAEGAVSRAAELTKQLLTFSRGGAPVKQAARLGEIIRESADFVLRGSAVACRYDLPAELWLVHSDAGQISQVVQNLVINARHAMPDGGELQIACANCPADTVDPVLGLTPGDYVVLTISDQGIGIPANIIDRIFDPFFSTKQDGSGLGLAITHSIIAKHGGHIAVTSKAGHGTRFTIHLPAAIKGDQAPESAPDLLAAPRSGRILVMDDEPGLRDVFARMLAHLGFTVETAASGREAVERYTAVRETDNSFDLVIMDLTIPGGMGGQEAAQEIIALDPAARILVSSGYSNDEIMANYRDYGFVGALAKPVLLTDLARTIDKALG